MTARFWTPQADDVAPADYDEVMADLRGDMGEVEGHECPECGADLDPGEACDCWDQTCPDTDEGDGYAAGGWDMGDQWE